MNAVILCVRGTKSFQDLYFDLQTRMIKGSIDSIFYIGMDDIYGDASVFVHKVVLL